MKLMLRTVPLSRTVELPLKPVPARVITVSLEPLIIAAGEIAESAGVTLYGLPMMLVVAVAWLFEATGSVSEALACTVITALPALVCRTLNMTVAEAPLARPPRLHITVFVVEQAPTDGTTELRTPDDGINAVSATLDAAAGP